MVNQAKNWWKRENSDGVENPLMTDVTALDGILSRCNDNRDIQKHVADDWEDFGDDSQSEVATVGRAFRNGSRFMLQNAAVVVGILNKALDCRRAMTGIVFESKRFHPNDLSFGNMTTEVG